MEGVSAGFPSRIASEAAVARSPRLPAEVRSCRLDDLAAWWPSRFKVSTPNARMRHTCRATWCADRGIDPQAARCAGVELWLRSVADSGLSRASIAAHYDAVTSIYRLARDEDFRASFASSVQPVPIARRMGFCSVGDGGREAAHNVRVSDVG
jgi:hypothetical protein